MQLQREAGRRAGPPPPTTARPRRSRRHRRADRAPPDHRPAAACTPDPSYTAGTSTHHLTVDGLAREFNVHLPPNPTANMPLVVNLHGAGSNMQEQELYSGFDTVPTKNGVVVAYPNGVDATIRQWNFLRAADIDFVREVAHTLVPRSVRRRGPGVHGRTLEWQTR